MKPTIIKSFPGQAVEEFRKTHGGRLPSECCYYCEVASDLRPYGPNGALVCFKCAMETPEREAETGKNFVQQLNAAGPVVLIGEETGPRPLGRKPS